MVKNSNYTKFIDEALELAKSIPRYFIKYPNKTYTIDRKINYFFYLLL